MLEQLSDVYPAYLQNKQLIAKIADYLAAKRAGIKETKVFNPAEEAGNARVLAEAVRNQKL